MRRDNFCLWLARKLPKRLVHWCVIVVWAELTVNPKIVAKDVTIDQALRNWGAL
jgi:hypothetical protein